MSGNADGNIRGFPSDAVGRTWPIMHEAAYHGLAGDVVRHILPETEADAVNLLTSFLVAYGSAAGMNLHAIADGHEHRANLFVVHVGVSGMGRKGTGWRQIARLMERVDPIWRRECVARGLSSGEGLIQALQAREQCEDSTTGDGRLCAVEEEFGGTLTLLARKGNILSSVVRQLYDGSEVRTLTRVPLHAKNAYVSIIGHVTGEELGQNLGRSDASNGFANRFLWMCVQRSKSLPDGGMPLEYGDLVPRIRRALEFARGHVRPIGRTPEARAQWHALYNDLTARGPGILGVITGRGEAQVLRLSIIYAALDGCPLVDTQHLDAAYAVWRYCEDSARYVFGDVLGDPLADVILQALKDAAPEGVSQTDISKLFNGHESSSRLRTTLEALEAAGLALRRVLPTKGARLTLWYARPEPNERMGR